MPRHRLQKRLTAIAGAAAALAGACQDLSADCELTLTCSHFGPEDGPSGPPQSCEGLPSSCGPGADEDCCTTTVVPGGTFDRSNDPASPATVSDFGLDRFEITVGRFRKFVEAYPGSKPEPGAGAHPEIAGSGWDPAWDAALAADPAALQALFHCEDFSTWTDAPGPNEDLPMGCISWYEAFAFCAWDGGRLPTEAEWNYAAAAGAEQREFPWGTGVDESYAVYIGGAGIERVGSRSPKGDGKWGAADLGGNLWEWVLDWSLDVYKTPCADCAELASGDFRVMRGGCWGCSTLWMRNDSRNAQGPSAHNDSIGARCARDP